LFQRLVMSWLQCCYACDEAPGLDAALTLVQDGEEGREWRIVQKALDSAEFSKLLQLRSRLQDCDEHPACEEQKLSRQPQTLLRFLRARAGEVRKAEAMFRAMLEWRHSFAVDEKVSSWRRELEQQRTQRSIQMRRFETDVDLCLDRHGVPIRLIRTSVADVQGLVREFGKDIVLIDTLLRMEDALLNIRQAMFEREELVHGQLQLIDMGDYGRHGVPNLVSRLWSSLQLAAEISQITDANYPETVRKAFILRLGSCTSMTWRYCIQPLLPERTQAKLIPCGPKASSWHSQLAKELPVDCLGSSLPAFLRSDSEEAFASAAPKGGLVPTGLAGAQQGRWEVAVAATRPKAPRMALKHRSLSVEGWCANLQVILFSAMALAAGALAVEPVSLL